MPDWRRMAFWYLLKRFAKRDSDAFVERSGETSVADLWEKYRRPNPGPGAVSVECAGMDDWTVEIDPNDPTRLLATAPESPPGHTVVYDEFGAPRLVKFDASNFGVSVRKINE